MAGMHQTCHDASVTQPHAMHACHLPTTARADLPQGLLWYLYPSNGCWCSCGMAVVLDVVIVYDDKAIDVAVYSPCSRRCWAVEREAF